MIYRTMEKVKKLHFVGIGGSGMFPIVQILHGQGYEITGSDNNEGKNIDQERAMGITVHMGHSADNLGDTEAVIYSAAIMQDNVELVAARERGIPTFERSVVLGYVTDQYDDCICISGTHGKTSVTAMLTHVLVKAGLDPTAVIGGSLPLIGGNGRAGKSEIMTCEACEFADTFLHLSPDIAVILNVDEDHLDYFKNLDNIIKAFHNFASLARKKVIVWGDDENSRKAVEGIQVPITTFGFEKNNDYYPANIQRTGPLTTTFDVMYKGEKQTTLTINVPGDHNITNTLAVYIAAKEVGAKDSDISAYLPSFRGAGRRFEFLGKVNGVEIVDDYAHHPLEIHNTLEVAKTMGYGKVWAVHQPFTYSRTALFLGDFAKALSLADHVVLSEIMGAREVNTYDIYAKDLADKIPNSIWFPEFPEIAEYVMTHAKPGDLVITMGCGDVYKCAHMMLAYGKDEE